MKTATSEARPLQRSSGTIKAVPSRSPWALIGSVLILLLVVGVIWVAVSNPRFRWGTVVGYLFDPLILNGIWITIQLTVVAMVIGILLGTLLAVMRQSKNLVFSSVSGAFIWFFRGTPVLVQLIFWFNLASLFPSIDFGLPYQTPFLSLDANQLITQSAAAILGLGLNEGAYMAEIIRGGIQSIGRGQGEAAAALGMNKALVFRRIILPQAMAVIIPPTGNQVIGMLKTTSLVSVLAISDLLYAAQTLYSKNFQTIPLLLTASIWYLAMTTLLTALQSRVEGHYSRGRAVAKSPRRTLRWRAQVSAMPSEQSSAATKEKQS